MSKAEGTTIGRKLTGMIMFTTTCAVIMASVGYLIADLSAMKSHDDTHMTTLARVIGDNASASILFSDRESARDVLQALRADPSIIAAGIYTRNGKEFVRYAPDPSFSFPLAMARD